MNAVCVASMAASTAPGRLDVNFASEKWISAAWGCRSYDALLRLAMEWVTVR